MYCVPVFLIVVNVGGCVLMYVLCASVLIVVNVWVCPMIAKCYL